MGTIKKQIKTKFYRCIYYLPISHSRISVTFTDQDLVKFYHFVSQCDALFFNKSGFLFSLLPWLKSKKGEGQISLLYALKVTFQSI